MAAKTVLVEMERLQKKVYDEFADELVSSGADIFTAEGLANLTKLTQLASATGEFSESGGLTLGIPSCKLPALRDIVTKAPDQIVIFAQSKQILEMTQKALRSWKIRMSVFVEGQRPDIRSKNQLQFSQQETPVALVSITSVGIGTNLASAPTAVFMQRSWTDIHNVWAESRLAADAKITHLVTSETVEVPQVRGSLTSLRRKLKSPDDVRAFLFGQRSVSGKSA